MDVITNGSKNPNERQGASGENFYEMLDKIDSLGPLNEVVESQDWIKAIIAYNGDRHFFHAFISRINKALKDNTLDVKSLKWFRAGLVSEWIINIDDTVSKYGNRAAYPAEILDKLNYLACLKDAKSFVSCFSKDEIKEALNSCNSSSELTYWRTNTEIPSEGRIALAYECLDAGYNEAARKLLQVVAKIYD